MFTAQAGTQDGDYLCMFNQQSNGALNIHEVSPKDVVKATISLVDKSLEYKH